MKIPSGKWSVIDKRAKQIEALDWKLNITDTNAVPGALTRPAAAMESAAAASAHHQCHRDEDAAECCGIPKVDDSKGYQK